MTLLDRLHQRHAAGRRVRVLAQHLSEVLPAGSRVLDIGAGDGAIAQEVMRRRSDVRIQGIDVLVRAGARIKVDPFDGVRIPFSDRAFDTAMLVDVLHHTTRGTVLLGEAARVAKSVVIKDHLADGLFAQTTLRFMDRVGNARFGVALPYCYWRRAQWDHAFASLGLTLEEWRDSLSLYPPIATAIFDRSLHFVARLRAA